jgi:branched-subunit amino acid transport protein
MTVLLAVLAVGLGSLLFRLVPLLGAERLPEGLARAAGWAGLSVLAALTVRSVVTHQDASLSPVTPAPVVAAVSVGLGLFLAYRGRSVLVAVASGAAAYVVIAGAVSGVSTFSSI